MEIPVGAVGGVRGSGRGEGVGGGRQDSRLRVSGPVLTILTTQDSDAGTYRCFANNTEGVAALQVKLFMT